MESSDKAKWEFYEVMKQKLLEMNVPPQDYERLIQKLVDMLGL